MIVYLSRQNVFYCMNNGIVHFIPVYMQVGYGYISSQAHQKVAI